MATTDTVPPNLTPGQMQRWLIACEATPGPYTDRDGMVEQQSITEGTLERLRTAQADIRAEYLAEHKDPWVIGFSGGKDSTLVTQLVFEMLLDLAPSDRKRPVHVLCNDTLVNRRS